MLLGLFSFKKRGFILGQYCVKIIIEGIALHKVDKAFCAHSELHTTFKAKVNLTRKCFKFRTFYCKNTTNICLLYYCFLEIFLHKL